MSHTDPAPGPLLPLSVKQTLVARAATLYERAAVRPLAAAGSRPAADAEAVVRAWEQTFSPGDPDAFAHRLTWDGLDRESARKAVAGGHPAVGDSLPAWTDWLDRMAHEAAGVLSDLRAGTLVEADPDRWTDEPPFVELWVVPLRAARSALFARVQASVRSRLTPDAHRALEQQLMREISLWAEHATFESFTGHYGSFVAGMLEGGLSDLFVAYPVLARQMARIVHQWVESTSELLLRLDRDLPAIAAAFGSDRPPGRVTSVAAALSDPHHGRRRVVVLGFESGLRVVYKPRDLVLEAAFHRLLVWLADRGLAESPRAPFVIRRDGYGWVEFVARGDQLGEDEVRAYYRQSGRLLCLAHVLRGQDLHMENVVATAEGPVLVDIELLLQPAAPPVTNSCLTTGLLSMFQTSPGGDVFDVGGLRGEGAGVRTLARQVWTHLRSDDLQFADETAFDDPTGNRVMLDGVAQRADDHADAILAGFAGTYRFLMTHRDELLDAEGPLAAFSGGRTRVIPRPTNQYAVLSAVLRKPRYQRDGARRSAAMDILLRPFNRSASRPRVWLVLLEERRALDALDVPYFWVSCSGTDACAGSEVVARDFFTQSGLAAAHDRIQSLSDRDRQRQEQLLVTALSESPASRFESPVPSATGSSGEAPERLGEAAVWIGTELRRLVRTRASAGHDPAPGSCPHLLYDGTIGPALFFAALHAVTNEAGWADDSRGALAPVCASIRHGEIDSWTADGIGAGDGLGSLVYGLTLASAFLNDGSLSDAAMNVASHLAGRVEGDGHFDVMSGAAGAALALLALHDYRRDPILLEWAAACGTHLVERHTRVDDGAAWPDVNGRRIVGFAHGAAGIAFTLQRLFERTAVSSFGDVARLAYRFERRQYLAGQANWPVADVPVGDASGAMPSMMAWCHGGPGIALANASALAGLGEVAAVEVETVLTAAARWIPSRPDHLCCGTLGRSEILLTVGRTLRRPEAVTAAHALAEQVVARARQVGHFRLSAPGFEYRVFDPGFFRGLSGIGYGLLRLAAPDRLPSVLAFEAPGRSRGGA